MSGFLVVVNAVLLSVLCLGFAVEPKSLRSPAAIGFINATPKQFVQSVEPNFQLSVQTLHAVQIRWELPVELMFDETQGLEEEALSEKAALKLIGELLPTHGEASFNFELEDIHRTGVPPIEGLPSIIPYRTPFLVPPAEALTLESGITFYWQDLSEFSDLDNPLKFLPTFKRLQLDQQTFEFLFRLQRAVTDDVLTQKSDGKVETDFEQNAEPQLEVAPGGGDYWIEDPDAAWW
jgi:hypothetical protein